MLLLLIIFVMAVLFVVLLVRYTHDSGSGGQPVAPAHSPPDGARFYRAHPAFNPDTGQWEDRDGTPYGAIDDLFLDGDSG